MIHDHWWIIVDKATQEPNPKCTPHATLGGALGFMRRKKCIFETPHVAIQVKECDGNIPMRRDIRGRRLWWWLVVEPDTKAPVPLLKVRTSYNRVKGAQKHKHVKPIKVIPA